jgi:hypothetical protein
MSGAGETFAGSGPAGAVDVAALSAGPVGGIPRALDYSSGAFAFDVDTGRYSSIHPIDQRARLALLNSRYRTEGGRVLLAIPAAGDQGFDWTTPFQWGEKLTADVTDRLRDAIRRAGLVIGEDLEEVRVSVSSARTAGRITWEYVYRNLRTAGEIVVSNGA